MFTRLKQVISAFSPGERRIFFVAGVVALVALVLFTVFVVREQTEVVPARGGAFTEGALGQPTYANPVLAGTSIDRGLVRLLFANVPTLAEKIETEEEGRLVRVRLKENLLWSDGAELTSDDVIFTVEKIQEPETGSPLFSAWQGTVASRGSKLEILFRLGSPYPLFAETLRNLYVIPKHLFVDVPSPNWRLSDYNLRPIGSGPYTFSSYERRQDGFITAYHLKENANYAGNRPLLTNFDFDFYSNEKDLLVAFNAGQVDGFVSPSAALLADVTRPHEVVAFDSPTSYAVFWNQSQNLPLQYVEVRKALELALDRDALVGSVLRGLGTPSYAPVPSGFKDMALPAMRPGADADAARKLLEENGWVIPEGKTVREKVIKKSTLPLSFSVLVPNVPFLTETAEALAAAWTAIGADVQIVTAPTDEVANSGIKNRNYESILFGNNIKKTGDLFAFWHSSERFYPGLNLALYNNKKADQLIEKIRAVTDGEERAAKVRDLQELIISDFPAAFLFSPDYVYVTRKDVRGISPELLEDVADRFLNVSGWHLETARVMKN